MLLSGPLGNLLRRTNGADRQHAYKSHLGIARSWECRLVQLREALAVLQETWPFMGVWQTYTRQSVVVSQIQRWCNGIRGVGLVESLDDFDSIDNSTK